MFSLKKISITLLLITMMLSLAGCGTTEERSREDTFRSTISYFENVLRWQSREEQLLLFANPSQANLPSDYGLRVTDMEITTTARDINENERVFEAKLYYLKESTQQISTVIDSQRWIWKGEERGWLRNNPMPTPR